MVHFHWDTLVSEYSLANTKGHFTHEPRAKSRDHEIARAQKNMLKGLPKTPPKHAVWTRILKCSVKSYATTPLTKSYFNELLFILSSHIIEYNKSTVVSIWNARVSWFYVRPTSKKMVFENSSSDHKTWSMSQSRAWSGPNTKQNDNNVV